MLGPSNFLPVLPGRLQASKEICWDRGHQRQNGAHSHTHTNSKDHASKLNVHAGKRWKLSRHAFQFAIFEEESSQGCDIWTCSLKDVVYVQGIRQRRVIVLVSIRGLFHKISLLAKMQFEIRHVDRSSKMWTVINRD